MSNETPPKRDSLARNPQVLAAVIGGLVTIVVAIIGIVPSLVNNRPTATPMPTVVVVTATSPPTALPTQAAPSPGEVPTQTTISAPVANVEPTSIPLPTQPLESTPASGNILLLYDEVSFTLRNQSQQIVSLEGITFSSTTGQWEARSWGPSVYDRLPVGMCLRLRDATVGQRQPPTPCRDQIFGLQEVGTAGLFWIGVATFDVLRNGAIIATCRLADGQCLITV